MTRNLTAVLSLIILSGLSAVPAAGETVVSVGVGAEFATGDYGTGATTDSVTVPLTIDIYPTKRLEFELVVPYIYQSNSSTVTAGGVRFKKRRGGSLVAASGGNGNGAGGNAYLAALTLLEDSASESGLGNVSLKAGFTVIEEGRFVPRIKPEVYVEFPTADKNKMLGTGEFVTGVGAVLDKWIGNWHAYVEGLYNFQGESSEFRLKDFFAYEVGVGYQVGDRFFPSILVKGATEPAEGASDLLETRLKATYRLTGRFSLEGYLAAGLSDGSPDFGAGAALFYDF